MLYNHKLKLDSEDYKLEQVKGFDLPSLYVVLKRFLELQSAGILGSTLRLVVFPSIFDSQENTYRVGIV